MAKLQHARELHFDTLDELLADAERIAVHPDAPTRGAWSASQNIWHVARYIQASVEGYPFLPPWWMKLIGPLMKRRLITQRMSPGFKAPSNVAKHMEPQSVSDEQTAIGPAVALLREWVGKAKSQGFIPANPVFGKMTARQWEQLHCRHAEHHFGLIALPDPASPSFN